jgi:hypothetical protein
MAATTSASNHSVYSDFSHPTPIRRDRLEVDGRVLFVNLGYLAELSVYFATLYESEETPITVPEEVSYGEMLELLRVVFYCPQRKPLTQANIVTILTCASVFDMEVVLRYCEDFIMKGISYFTNNRIFEMTQVLSRYQRNSVSMSILIQKLAAMNDSELPSLPFSSIPGDVVADIYAVKLRESIRVERQRRASVSFASCFDAVFTQWWKII